MIPAAEMAAMIATAQGSLDTAVTLQRNTPTTDVWGSQVEHWATVATTTARIATPNTPMLAQIAARIGATVMFKVSLPLALDVRVKDRLIIGPDTLYIHAVETPQSYSTVNQVLAAEVR